MFRQTLRAQCRDEKDEESYGPVLNSQPSFTIGERSVCWSSSFSLYPTSSMSGKLKLELQASAECFGQGVGAISDARQPPPPGHPRIKHFGDVGMIHHRQRLPFGSNRATTCLVSIPSLMTLSATRRRTGSVCSA